MKKNMSKIVAIILALILVVSVFAGCKKAPSHESKVIYGSTTEISGDLGNAWWTNNASDKLIRDLIDDYSVISADQGGQLVVNSTVAESVDNVENADDTRTYTVKIKKGLTYNNGEPITAADYVAYALVQYSPATLEAGAKVTTDSVLGATEYQSGEAKELAGVRLLDEYTYSITIIGDYANYYFGLLNASLAPLYLPMYSSADLTVKDDGDGAYLDGGELKADEVNASRYIYADRVSAGPYQIESLDTTALKATLVINPKFAGNFEGQKPSIKTIEIVKAEDETMMDSFKTGEIDFLSEVSEGDKINAGLDLVEAGGYDYCHYTRNGYGKLLFQCDFGPTQFVAVRQAIAYLLDRNEFAMTFCGGFGSVVHGPYSTAQWMYEKSEELFNEKLNTYSYNPAKAVELLEADGWTLNADGTEYSGSGVRYKEVTPEEAGDFKLNVTLDDGRILMPLHIMWASSEGNSVSDLLATMLANGQQVADAGMVIEQNIMTFSELLNWLYRDTSVGDQYGVRTYGMFNLGTGWDAIYDYSYNFVSDPDHPYVAMGVNTNFIFDKELDEYSMDMVYKAAPGENDVFLDYYQKFVIRFNELLPDLALYCNDYHTFFPSWLKNYEESSLWDFQHAIIYASIK